MIKYLGSKRLLIPRILEAVAGAGGVRSVVDLFSGTARVGHALKGAGYRVVANDHLSFAHALAVCYVQADRGEVIHDVERWVREFNALGDGACEALAVADGGEGGAGGKGGWFVEAYCERARYFHPRNGVRIAAIRGMIARLAAAGQIRAEVEAVLLTALMQAADRVDCTAAVQMAYLKDYPPRAFKRLELRVPGVLERGAGGRCEALCMEAEAAAALVDADAAYIDPPYNQHSYLGNYHVWETLVRWDRPEVYGRACKRVDVKTRRSDFNSKVRCRGALERVVAAARAPVLIVSFNDEGYLSEEELESVLSSRGRVSRVEVDYKRYVGAQIGIYSPAGEKVGTVGRLRNREFLYTVDGR